MTTVSNTSSISDASSTSAAPSTAAVTGSQLANRSVILNKLTADAATLSARAASYKQLSQSLQAFRAALRTLENGTAVAGITATSSSPLVTATVGNNAVAGSYAVSVTRLAQSQVNTSANSVTATSAANQGSGTLGIKVGNSATTNVNITATMSLTDIANAINNANAGVKAQVSGSTGAYNIVLTGNQTGAANAVTFVQSGVTLNFASTQNQAALDSNYTVNGTAYTSTYNNMASGIPGTSLALTGLVSNAVVTLGASPAAVQAAVSSLVTTFNSTITAINGLQSASPQQDIVLNTIDRQLNRVATQSNNGTTGAFSSLASIGVAQNPDGTLLINSSVLSAATTQNASSVANLLSGNSVQGPNGAGLAASLYNVAQSFGEASVGALDRVGFKQSKNALHLTRAIYKQQRYVEAAAKGVEQQYTDLQVALSQLQSKSLFVQTLTAQIGIQSSSYNVALGS